MGKTESAWTIRLLSAGAPLPPDERVSAVFLLAMTDQSILAVRNERGWDLPGGHIEPGESAEAALARETREEAGASFSSAQAFAIVGVPDRSDVMLFYVTSAFVLSGFSPAEDALERAFIPVDQFRSKYCGPAEVLQCLLDGASACLVRRKRM